MANPNINPGKRFLSRLSPLNLKAAWPGIALFLLGCGLLGWLYWPIKQQQSTLILSATTVNDLAPEMSPFAGSQVRLTYPTVLRVGENAQVSLEIQPPPLPALSPTQGLGRASIEALARLDLPGIETHPGEEASMGWRPGETIRFEWTVTPGRSGKYSGQAWFYIQVFGPGEEAPHEIPLTAQTFEISVLNTLGIPLAQLKILAWLSLLLGTFITLGMLTFVRDR